MGILKKPKFLILAGAILLAVIALTAALIFSKPKTVGFFGLDRESDEAIRLQAVLEDAGYTVYYGDTMDELKNTHCKAWIVRTTSDIFAEKIFEVIGDKAIFIERKPTLSQPVRYVGGDMENAGSILAHLTSLLPLGGDSNEDGTVSCLLLTGYADWRTTQWQKGLEEGASSTQLPIEILEAISCARTEEAAQQAVTEILSQYGRDIEVILTSDEILAEGAAKAISGRGWTQGEDFYLLSTGYREKASEALNNLQRSGMAYAWEDAYNEALCSAVRDTIAGKSPKEYLHSYNLLNNSSPLQ